MAGRGEDDGSDLGSRKGIPPFSGASSASAEAAQGAHSSSFGGGGQNNFGMLPIYSGSRHRGAFRDWRTEVTAFGVAFQVPKDEGAPRAWLRLAGEARDAVEIWT